VHSGVFKLPITNFRVRHVTSDTTAVPYNPIAFFSEYGGQPVNEILVVGIHQSKRPGRDPGRLLLPTERRWWQ